MNNIKYVYIHSKAIGINQYCLINAHLYIYTVHFHSITNCMKHILGKIYSAKRFGRLYIGKYRMHAHIIIPMQDIISGLRKY